MILEKLLYTLNCILFIFGIALFSYSTNKPNNSTIIDLNCSDMYFLCFMGMVNSVICLLTIKKLKLIAFLSTSGIFAYNVYNIGNISLNCSLEDNYIWYYYIITTIINGYAILLYITLLIVICCDDSSKSSQQNKYKTISNRRIQSYRNQPITHLIDDNLLINNDDNINANVLINNDDNINANVLNNYE